MIITPIPQLMAPCPHCGYCPHCGRSNAVSLATPTPPLPGPIWMGVGNSLEPASITTNPIGTIS